MTDFSFCLSGLKQCEKWTVGGFWQKVSDVGEERLGRGRIRLYHCRCFELFDLNYAMNIIDMTI